MNALHSTAAVLDADREPWRLEGAGIKRSPALFSLCLSLLVVLLLSGRGLAASTASLSAGTTNPVVGQTFAVAVNLSGATGFACWGSVVRYDGAKLALVSQTNGTFGTFVADSRGSAAMNASGQSRTGGYGMSNNAGGAGTLAVFTFQALADGVTTIAMDPQSAGSPFGLALYSTNGTVAIPSVGAPLTIVIGGGNDPYQTWREAYFTAAQLTNAAVSGDAADPDHDGLPNWKEYRAGTDPMQVGSCLALSAPTNSVAEAGKFVVCWSSVTNKRYTLQAGTNLLHGFTTNLCTNILATPPFNFYTNDVGPAASRFYRVKVE